MNWYEITTKYNNNIPYKDGSLNIGDGLDCVGLLISFYEDIGKDVSKIKNMVFEYENKKVTIDDYSTISENILEKNEIYKTFLRENFKKVDKPHKGDIVIFTFQKMDAIGIYTGVNLLLCVFEGIGVRTIKIKPSFITEVYQWDH